MKLSNKLVVRVLSHIKHSATRRVLYCDKTLLYTRLLNITSNTSYKRGISNDNCIECPMNTAGNVNRNNCVCKDGYYKSSPDKSEVSPCYGKLADLLLFFQLFEIIYCPSTRR